MVTSKKILFLNFLSFKIIFSTFCLKINKFINKLFTFGDILCYEINYTIMHSILQFFQFFNFVSDFLIEFFLTVSIYW